METMNERVSLLEQNLIEAESTIYLLIDILYDHCAQDENDDDSCPALLRLQRLGADGYLKELGEKRRANESR
jgi:hypothetical protein